MAISIKTINVNLKNSLARVSKNLSWLFFILLLFLLVLDGFKIKQSINDVVSSNDVPQDTKTERGVRVNFEAYQKAVLRIQNAKTFAPTSTPYGNPFISR